LVLEQMLKELVAPKLKTILKNLNANSSFATLKVVS
jgi:hypothetical protein